MTTYNLSQQDTRLARFGRGISNLFRYGTTSLPPPVDPFFMRRIFLNHLEQLPCFSLKNDLALWKRKKEDLHFHYALSPKKCSTLSGVIYAREPRKDFEDVDVFSFMNIKHFSPHPTEKLFDALQGIVEDAYIQRVTVGPMSSFRDCEARLRQIRGPDPRYFHQWR